MLMPNVSLLKKLTPREREVLTLVAQGLTLAEIAEKLHRSLKTIETHRLALGKKMGASNRVELARLAIAAGLAPIEVFVEDAQDNNTAHDKTRQELESQARTLKCFEQINNEVFSTTGPEFLRKLVLSLSRVLGIRNAAICILADPKTNLLNPLALCDYRTVLDTERYLAHCTPCDTVLREGHAIYAQGVAQQFPDDVFLQMLDSQSYVGVRLDDPQGDALGVLSVLHDKSLGDGLHVETILRLFAPRTAAELSQILASDRERERTENAPTQDPTQDPPQDDSPNPPQALFNTIIERSTDGYCSVDAKGTLTHINPSMCNMLGQNAQDLINKQTFRNLTPPNEREAFDNNRYKNTGKRTNTYRIRLQHTDGSLVPFQVISHSQVDETNQYLGCFAVFTQDNQDK